VLEPRAVAVAPALREGDAPVLRRSAGLVAGVVVLDLVGVPLADQRELPADLAQVLVGVVQGVLGRYSSSVCASPSAAESSSRTGALVDAKACS
jgi:hypothetical protein